MVSLLSVDVTTLDLTCAANFLGVGNIRSYFFDSALWQRGKPLTWDVTVAHTLADSYVSATARSGGAAAEQAAGLKSEKIRPFGTDRSPVSTDRRRDAWPLE